YVERVELLDVGAFRKLPVFSFFELRGDVGAVFAPLQPVSSGVPTGESDGCILGQLVGEEIGRTFTGVAPRGIRGGVDVGDCLGNGSGDRFRILLLLSRETVRLPASGVNLAAGRVRGPAVIGSAPRRGGGCDRHARGLHGGG